MSQIIIVLYRNWDIFHVVVDHQMAVHATNLLDLLSTINFRELHCAYSLRPNVLLEAFNKYMIFCCILWHSQCQCVATVILCVFLFRWRC